MEGNVVWRGSLMVCFVTVNGIEIQRFLTLDSFWLKELRVLQICFSSVFFSWRTCHRAWLTTSNHLLAFKATATQLTNRLSRWETEKNSLRKAKNKNSEVFQVHEQFRSQFYANLNFSSYSMRRLQRPHREEAEEEKTNFSLSFETCLVVRGPLLQ